MKDLKELLQQFDEIQELPVSEETVGAYVEGNVDKETLFSRGDSNSLLSDLLDNFENEIDQSDSTDDINFLSSFDEDNIVEQFNKVYNMDENKLTQSLWGEPGQNFKDPFFIQQPDDHSCALRSQQIVLRDFGIDIPFKDLEKIALDYGVYSEDGTWTTDIGKVLEIAGVPMHQTWDATIHDLTHELAQGHRIIVSVDAHELWNNDTIMGKFNNWFNDVIGNQGGNHALIVAGVEVNSQAPSDVKVVLTDPGSGDLRIEYPMEQFMDAWKDSNCFMAATDNPAPYQYDPATGKEVPSNFVIEQHFNEFVANNSYQLAPDLINVPDDYVAKYEGHLDMVGDMDYETFDKQYQNAVSSRNAALTNDDSHDNSSNTDNLKSNENREHNDTSDEEHDDDDETDDTEDNKDSWDEHEDDQDDTDEQDYDDNDDEE